MMELPIYAPMYTRTASSPQNPATTGMPKSPAFRYTKASFCTGSPVMRPAQSTPRSINTMVEAATKNSSGRLVATV